jgi:hypothetical protein
MGGVFKPDAPPAPDYAAMAKEQGIANKDAAIYNTQLNRANQLTPYGNSTWTQGAAGADGSPGQWTQTVTLSPEMQQLQDMQNKSSLAYGAAANAGLSKATDALAKPFDTSGLGPLSQGGKDVSDFSATPVNVGKMVGSFNNGKLASGGGAVASLAAAGRDAAAGTASIGGGDIQRTFDTSGVRALPGTIDDTSRRRVEEALMSRLNPQLQRDEADLRSRLLNSGIEVGTNAYNRELNNFGQKSNDARMQAILAGGQEESRQVGLIQGLNAQEYGQALSTGNFAQSADKTRTQQALDASIANAQMQTQISQANAARDAQIAIANAGYGTQASLANAQLGSHASEVNAGNDLDSRKAQLTAMLGGAQLNNAAQNQNFQNGLAYQQFGNQARQQGIEEQAFLRTQPLNELNALRSGSQVTGPQFGSYYTGGNAAAAPVMDAGLAAGNFAMDSYKNAQSGSNALMGGLASLGSAFLM